MTPFVMAVRATTNAGHKKFHSTQCRPADCFRCASQGRSADAGGAAYLTFHKLPRVRGATNSVASTALPQSSMNALLKTPKFQPCFPHRDSGPRWSLSGRQVGDIAPAAFTALSTLAHSLQDTHSFLRPAPLHILVADDCPLQQLLACALLSRWGLMPQLASDGMEAVLLAGEHRFDMILMDLDMPVMDGLTATLRLRAQEAANRVSSPVPVVAYTAASSADDRQWRQSGMNALLAKASDALAMGECLERWCSCKFTTSQH